MVRFWKNLLNFKHVYQAWFPTKTSFSQSTACKHNRNGQIAPAKVQLSDTKPSGYMLPHKNRTVQELDICSRQLMPYRNGRQGMVSDLRPTNAKSYISLHPVPGSSDPQILGFVTHLCQWRSRQSSSGFGGIRTSPSRSTSGHWRLSARRPSTSSEWSHTWSGVGTETLFWCCTGPLSDPS